MYRTDKYRKHIFQTLKTLKSGQNPAQEEKPEADADTRFYEKDNEYSVWDKHSACSSFNRVQLKGNF